MRPCFGWHDWGKWKAYTWAGRVAPRIGAFALETDQNLWPNITVERQRRECLRCGKTQDERV